MSDKARILEKIQKCLNLSKSTNQHEAAQALKQAYALMKKHEIDEGDALEIIQFTSGDSIDCCKTKKIPRYLAMLISSIGRCFSVRSTIDGEIKFTSSSTKFHRTVKFFGHKSDVLIAEYAWVYLSKLLIKARKKYIHQNQKVCSKTKMADLFAEGWVRGVYNEMYKIRRITDDEEHHEKCKNIEQYIKTCFGDLETEKIKQTPQMDRKSIIATIEGFNAASEVSINIAVNSSESVVLIN